MLTFVKSQDITLTFTFEQASGAACDITGTEIILTVKANQTDADPGVLQVKLSPITYTDSNNVIWDTTQGQTTISLDPSQTGITPGTYWWDIKIVSGGKEFPMNAAQLQVLQNITTASS